MAATKPTYGCRVMRLDTEQAATYVDAFQKGGYEVLLDDGPKQVTDWPDVEIEVISGRRRSCDRCGSPDHHAFDCPP